MGTWIGQASGTLARGRAGRKVLLGDGVTHQDGDNQNNGGSRRIDAKTVLLPALHELDDLLEERYQGRKVRVKNTSGGNWPAGTLLAPPSTSALTAPSTATATDSPAAGASVVITVSGSYAVGQMVKVTTTGVLTGSLDLVEYAFITATGSGTITVDLLAYTHTLPTIYVDSAINAVVADVAGVPAEWVVQTAIANGAYGDALGAVEVTGLATNSFSAYAALWLTSSGGYTTTEPARSLTNVVQMVGIVKVSHATTGIIKFFPGVKRIKSLAGSVPTSAISGGLLIGQGGGGAFTETAVTGDITITNGGVTSIGADKVTTAKILNSNVTLAKIANGTALSVLGVTGNAGAAYADMVAGSDFQVMRRSGTAIAFGAVNLASSNAVTGVLPHGNLGSGGGGSTKFLREDSTWQTASTTFASAAEAKAATSTTVSLNPSNLNDYTTPQTLTDGATINWDMSLGIIAQVTLGGNRTLASFTNGRAGSLAILTIIQDGTGGRTLSINGNYNFGNTANPTLSTNSSAVDRLYCLVYDSTHARCWLNRSDGTQISQFDIASTALSVVGRSANTAGALGYIAAANDNEVMRRSGTSIGYGAINLAASAAVSGLLSASNLNIVSSTVSGAINTTSSTYQATGLSCTITPSSSSRKILILIYSGYVSCGATNYIDIQITAAGADTTQFYNTALYNTYVGPLSVMWVHSPATGSSITYTAKYKSDNGVGQVDFINSAQTGNQAMMIVMEIP